MNRSPVIGEVSDTGIWVAYCRAVENERDDALFHDRVAQKLAGERGRAIYVQLKSLSRYTQFHVVVRTVVIDRFIRQLLNLGIDTVLNLGAGLDTRPYRLKLPVNLRWIEIDYPHVVEFKNKALQGEEPSVSIERIGLDLANREERRKFFSHIGTSSRNVLVLTEGVLGYMTSQQVGELADDLHAEENFRYWIGEYNSPLAYRFIENSAHRKGMENAPFRFMPKDWDGFFREHRWEKQEVAYLMEEAARLKRPIPKPWWARLLWPFAPRPLREKVEQMTGYAIYKPIR